MSDDLVKRLRSHDYDHAYNLKTDEELYAERDEAADRIEELEAEVGRLTARVAELEDVAGDLLTRFDAWSPHDHIAAAKARKALGDTP